MHKTEILLLSLIVVIVVGGPLYVVFVRDSTQPVVSSSQPKSDSQPATEEPKATATEPEPVAFDTTKYSTTDPASVWIVTNKQRPLSPITYAPTDLASVGGGQRLRAEPARQLTAMMADAKSAGLTLVPLSGYRSYSTQVSVYNNEVKTYGQAKADTQSARPGTSEHQTGLAIDVGGGGCGVEDCFGATPEGKWVAANAYKYGYIVRYTAGKEAITGYRAEPWHIRYVGTELSTEMQKQGVPTLEEFFGLPAAPSY